jgi:hypothetical protein
MFPWNLASTVYPVARPGVVLTHDPDGALWVAPDGSIGPVGLADVSAPSAAGCLTEADGPVQVVAPAGDVLIGVSPPLLLGLHHVAGTDAGVGSRLLVLVGPAGAPGRATQYGDLVTLADDGDLAMPVAVGPADAVYVLVQGRGRVCLDDVRLTRPE